MGNPRKQMKKISEYVGIYFTNHTFRRTFASAASDCGLPNDSIKQMLNHKSSDVTAGYIITTISSLTPKFQQVADEIYSKATGDKPHQMMNAFNPLDETDDF